MTSIQLRTEQGLLTEAWQQLETELALCLAHLENNEFLIVGSKHANTYVQFSQQGAFGMRMEAACNAYIEPPTALLTVEDYARMRELEWNEATESVAQEQSDERQLAGSPNFFIEVPLPINYPELARRAVQTLREVYRIGHPAQLEYSAFSDEGMQIRFPSLRINRRVVVVEQE